VHLNNLNAPVLNVLTNKGKGKGHHGTGHEGPEGEERYSSTLSLTSTLDGVGGQRQATANLLLGKTRYALYRRRGGAQGRSGRVWKISPPLRFGPRTIQPIAQSLYRLSYPGPLVNKYRPKILTLERHCLYLRLRL